MKVTPDGHPEDYCDWCRNPNPIWFAQNELWNKVMGTDGIIICPKCFQEKAKSLLGINVIIEAKEET